MLTLALSAAMVIVIDPPELPRCDMPAQYQTLMPGGEIVPTVRATYLPSSLGIVITPSDETSRIYCDGFE